MTTQTFNRFGVKACYPCKPCPPPQFECENCDTCRPVVGEMTLNEPDCVFAVGAATPPVTARCTPYPPTGAFPTGSGPCEYYAHFYDDVGFGPVECNMFSDGAQPDPDRISGIDDAQGPLGIERYEAVLPRWPTCNGLVPGLVLTGVNGARCPQITIDIDLTGDCPETLDCATGSLDMNNVDGLNAAGAFVYTFNGVGLISMAKPLGLDSINELTATVQHRTVASIEGGQLVLRVIFNDRVGNPGTVWGFAWHAWSDAYNGCGAYTLTPDAARSAGEVGGAILPAANIFLELFA